MSTRDFGDDDSIARYDTPLGEMTLAASPRGLRGAWFQGQRHFPTLPGRDMTPDHPVLREAARQLREYLTGARRSFDLPLDFSLGTPFQQAVWKAMLAVPFGETTSYRALAVVVQKPSAVRAVGASVGRNPLSVILPCHRVLGSDGSLTGYAGGLDRKRALLALESR